MLGRGSSAVLEADPFLERVETKGSGERRVLPPVCSAVDETEQNKTKQNNSPAEETEAEAGRTLRGGSRGGQGGGRPETLESGSRPTWSQEVRAGRGHKLPVILKIERARVLQARRQKLRGTNTQEQDRGCLCLMMVSL